MDIERLVVKITADASQYLNVLHAVEARLVAFGSIVATALGGMSVRLAAQFERASIAFEVMMGDATKAQKILGEVVQMALETPFHSSELIEAAKQLRAFGFAGDEIMPVLRALANVSSGTGAELSRIGLAFGQVRVAGRLMGAELRQFINAGVPLIEELAKELDKPRELIASMVHEGQIGWPEVVRAFNRMTQAGGLYAGMNERINRETVAGQWEQFTETLQVIARNFGGALLKGLKVREILSSLSDALTMNAVTVNAWTNAFDEIREILADVYVGFVAFYRFLDNSLVGEIVSVFIQFGLALRLVSIVVGGLTLAWRALLIVFNVSGIWRIVGVLTTLVIVLVKAVIATVAWAVALAAVNMQWVFFGALLAVGVTLLVRILDTLGAFADVGKEIGRVFRELGETFSKSWKAIEMAMEAGDTALAAQIAFKTLEVAWAKTIAALKAEWFGFIESLSASDVVMGGNALALVETNRMARRALVNARYTAAAQLGGGFFADPAVLNQMKTEEMNQIDREASAQRVHIINRFNEEMNKRREAAQPALDLMMKGAGARQQAELDALTAKMSFMNRFSGKLVQGLSATFGDKGPGIPVPISVESRAKQQAEAVQHELLARGTGPFALFQTTMKNLNEAFKGPEQQPGLMGLVGGGAAGGVKNVGAILNTAEFQFGAFKAYDELRRSLGQPASSRLPATMFRGSQEAQDTINRSLTQSTSVEQDILAVITEAKEIQARQEDYQKQAAEYLKKLAETGVITGK